MVKTLRPQRFSSCTPRLRSHSHPKVNLRHLMNVDHRITEICTKPGDDLIAKFVNDWC